MSIPLQPMTLSDPETARLYVDAVASMSRIGEGEAYLGREMLLANYTGVEPSIRSLDGVESALDGFDRGIVGTTGHARAYLSALSRGARAVLSILRGEDRPYFDLVRDIIEVEFREIPASETERLRSELRDGLGALGYRGSLERQVEDWLAATSLRGDAVIDFAHQTLARAREDTIVRVADLPGGEGVDSVEGVRNVFYSGRSHYVGDYRGWLRFNVDKDWQRDVFTQVLCHEAYPGHQTFYTLWDHGYRNGVWPMEAALYTRNAPTNPIFEGGPEVAMHLIGWDEGDSEEALALRVGQVYKDLGRIAMNDVCLLLNVGEMKEAHAVKRMKAHFVREDDAERVVKFVTNPVSRTHYPQYYYGRRVVNLACQRMEQDAESRRRFIDILYHTPHTTSTFIDAVSDATGHPFDPFAYA